MPLADVKTVVTTPLQIIGEVVQFIKSNTVDYYKTTSLSEATKLARVEPITVLSRDCMNLDYTSDVLQSVLNIFAGYYLQAVSLSARVGGVRIVKILDRLNPDRDSSGFFATMESHSSPNLLLSDNYKYRLPRSHMRVSTEGELLDAMYDDVDTAEIIKNRNARPGSAGTDYEREMFGKNVLNEAANLAVGKMLRVSVTVDEHTMEMPVNIRLAPAVIPNASVEHIVALKKEENSIMERYHAWRAGRLSFIRDLMLCQDLIDTHRKALMNDESGVYSEIIRRANNAKKYGLLTQNPSLVSASSIFVISEESAKNIERHLGGKLTNPRIRQKAFENTYGMLIIVIDREWERVSIYHRGVAASTEVSIRDIKAINKKSGPDIADIMRAYSSGSPISF